MDLPVLLRLVADARASGHPHACLHPGGLQWLLRKVGQPDFQVWSSPDGRAAWSTVAPSKYDATAHDAVVSMPQFDRTLVPVVAAPDGTLAAYCIAWFDPVTRTSEIEPLGTRPEYRRLGLARAVSLEAVRRSAERGAESVLVWGVGDHRTALYESAGFRGGRVLREYARRL